MSNTLINLTLHGVGQPERQLSPGEEKVWLSLESFHRLLDAVPRDVNMTITFDDGNVSDVKYALPALLKRGPKATFFVIANRIDQKGTLSREDLHTLLESGMEVGSHGMRHRSWQGMSAAVMQEEIFQAKECIEAVIGRPVTKAACPFGTYDRRSLAQLKKAGFEVVYTSDAGSTRASQWLQARNTLHKSDRPEVVASLLAENPWGAKSWVRCVKRLVKRWR
jgi:peptidoglycan/xylan/chitin deacetylase (PgdA/CDA1 family)